MYTPEELIKKVKMFNARSIDKTRTREDRAYESGKAMAYYDVLYELDPMSAYYMYRPDES